MVTQRYRKAYTERPPSENAFPSLDGSDELVACLLALANLPGYTLEKVECSRHRNWFDHQSDQRAPALYENKLKERMRAPSKGAPSKGACIRSTTSNIQGIYVNN